MVREKKCLLNGKGLACRLCVREKMTNDDRDDDWSVMVRVDILL